MMLKDKVAVIYGAGGAIGGAVACAFASDGARLFLTGRSLAPVEVVAKEIVAAGGSAGAAEVDALDEQAVDEHLQTVIDNAVRVDISFNASASRTRTSSPYRWSRWRGMAKRSTEEDPVAGLSALAALAGPSRPRDFEVPRQDLPKLAQANAERPPAKSNPRPAPPDVVLELLEEMW